MYASLMRGDGIRESPMYMFLVTFWIQESARSLCEKMFTPSMKVHTCSIAFLLTYEGYDNRISLRALPFFRQ